MQALRDVSVDAPPRAVTAIVGPNGAGKTTFARALAGLHRQKTGRVLLNGRDVSSASAVDIARSGIALVPQGRRLFGSLTVAEHFDVARRHRREGAMEIPQLLEVFPNLANRLRTRARSLSGGEQQMLAIARAVLSGPDVLVLDEPTEGLAPSIVAHVRQLIEHVRENGRVVLLLEQSGHFPHSVADVVHEISRGVVAAAPVVVEEVDR